MTKRMTPQQIMDLYFMQLCVKTNDDVNFALKAMLQTDEGNCNETERKQVFLFFQPLPSNFLSLFQFVSGSRAEREVCTINGTGSLAYSRSGKMQSRNENSSIHNRHIPHLSNEDIEVSHPQDDTQTDQMPLTAMHSHPYLSYHPSHSQMVGMPQMVTAHGIENHFQVKNCPKSYSFLNLF